MYILCLPEGGMSSSTVRKSFGIESIENSSDEDSTHDKSKNKKKRKKTKKEKFVTTTRLDSDLVRDLLTCVTQLVGAGQPDIRAAATTAAIFLGHSIVDQTVLLGEKMDVTTRQFAAAIGASKGKHKKGPKIESLRHQIDLLKRTKADLEDIISTTIIQGIFVHRKCCVFFSFVLGLYYCMLLKLFISFHLAPLPPGYRDSNWSIRVSCIDALARMTTQRPDFFLMDKYLKYFGWLLSDKAEHVRIAALTRLLRPIHAAKTFEISGKGVNIDLSLLENVISTFFPVSASVFHQANAHEPSFEF